MSVMAAVAEIQTEHIHACLRQSQHLFGGAAGWPQSGNDAGVAGTVHTDVSSETHNHSSGGVVTFVPTKSRRRYGTCGLRNKSLLR